VQNEKILAQGFEDCNKRRLGHGLQLKISYGIFEKAVSV
jgi:hypothetical protein